MTLAAYWLHAFALTLLVESLAATPLLAPAERSLARRLALVLFANLASHPLAYLGLPLLELPRAALLVVMETWAVASEAAFYRVARPALPWTRALATSALANGLSFGAGLVVHEATGWV